MSSTDMKTITIAVIASAIITTLLLSTLVFTLPTFQDVLRGPQGIEGEQGPQGIQGEVGPIGAQGIQGIQGPIGLQGEQGDIGPSGPVGLQGPQGIRGPEGPIYNYSGNWETVFMYDETMNIDDEWTWTFTIESDIWQIYWWVYSPYESSSLGFAFNVYDVLNDNEVEAYVGTSDDLAGDVAYIFGSGIYQIEIGVYDYERYVLWVSQMNGDEQQPS